MGYCSCFIPFHGECVSTYSSNEAANNGKHNSHGAAFIKQLILKIFDFHSWIYWFNNLIDNDWLPAAVHFPTSCWYDHERHTPMKRGTLRLVWNHQPFLLSRKSLGKTNLSPETTIKNLLLIIRASLAYQKNLMTPYNTFACKSSLLYTLSVLFINYIKVIKFSTHENPKSCSTIYWTLGHSIWIFY